MKRNYYHFEGRGESQISGKGKLRLEWGGEGRSERARGEESMTTSPMGLCNPLREGTVQTGWEEWTGRHTDPQSHLAVVGTTTDTRTHMLITSPRTYIHAYIDCVGRINHNDKSTPLQYCLRLAAVRYATLHKYTWSIRRLYEIILHSLNLQSPAAYIMELRGPSLMVFWIFDDGCVAYKNHGFMVVLYVVIY